MDVLSTESLERIRISCMENPNLVECTFEELEDLLNLSLVKFNAPIDECPDLFLPQGKGQEKNQDLENCKLLSEAFSGLSASMATDERLWVTLCFRDYAEYTRLRWPLSGAKTPVNYVQDHWFAKSARGRISDNSLARLWWIAHIAGRVPNSSVEDVLKDLLFNSDYRSSLLERNSSANAINVVVSILSISQKAFDNGVGYNRDKFRSFMKKVNFIGKRTSLPSLSPEALEELLSPIYAEAYGLDKKKSSLLSRFFGQ